MAEILKESAPPRDVDLFFSSATATNEDEEAQVKITASGEDIKQSGLSDNFFTVTFHSQQPGQTLNTLTIDLGGTGLVFDPISHPVHVGSSTGPTIVSATPNTVTSTLTLTFRGFSSGNSLSFGVDRDFTDINGNVIEFGGSSGDELAGATVTATLSSSPGQNDRVLQGKFRNRLGQGYQVFDGFGLIDALNALGLIQDRQQ